jgi:hypothetical protein
MMVGIMERKTARGDEALEGVEGNGDNIGNLCAVQEDGTSGTIGTTP